MLREVLIALYRAERELLPLPSVLLMRASVCASPPVEAPHGLPSCQDLENKKISLPSCHTPRFCRVRIIVLKRFAHVLRTYTPATGFELILFSCHTCFLGKKGMSHFFLGNFQAMCYVCTPVTGSEFFFLLTILIMVFHQR